MKNAFDSQLHQDIEALKKAGTYKALKHLDGPMDAHAQMREAGGDVLVMSSNNYLGLSNHPHVIKKSHKALEQYGAGTASVRFICGTMSIHEQLEQQLADFHKTEAALTYSSCWAANTGLLPVICQPGGVLISDELNHASIIDGARLVSKQVTREIYKHSSMEHLEELLLKHVDAINKFIVTDGVFSMEGDLANLPKIVELANRHKATVIVDDSHGVGVMGKHGHGVAEHFGVEEHIDIYTGTLGKSLGGAAGGYVAGRQDIIDMLIQKSRPHIFSNAISPATAGAAMGALDVLTKHPEMVAELHGKVAYFRDGLKKLGFKPLDGESAIVPIIVGETATAIRLSEELLKEHIFVTGFGFPVVPEGAARIRVQISQALSYADMDKALEAFRKVGEKNGLLAA